MICGDKGHLTAKGTPCQQNIPRNGTACIWHSRSPEGRRVLAMKGGLASRMMRYLPKSSAHPDFATTGAIVSWAQETARQVLCGDLDPRAAGEARQLAALTIAARVSDAQERIADVLASVEHGSAAMLLLSRLKEGMLAGRGQPLSATLLRRKIGPAPPPDEPTPA